ncbi:MAG TPA: hypothetical protein DCE18_10310 [Syntrophobacteraceae bacterium]|jgi:hypothetical protein|nr:hypothetical protein [Syntrophobacteraceae bacterium]HBZ55092.1 hypothetical protein [Syntrophobacteraceae bacterium]
MAFKPKWVLRLFCSLAGMALLTGFVLAVYRTYERAGDAHILTQLAGFDERRQSLNPFSETGCPITPNMAVWILENFNHPYSHCCPFSRSLGICGTPLIMWAGRGLGTGPVVADERLFRVVRHFIRRGENVNASHDGLTALHEAVLFANPQYAEMLLTHGANPYATIQRPGKKSHGLNAFELAELLSTRNPGRFDTVRSVLAKFSEPSPTASAPETPTPSSHRTSGND